MRMDNMTSGGRFYGRPGVQATGCAVPPSAFVQYANPAQPGVVMPYNGGYAYNAPSGTPDGSDPNADPNSDPNAEPTTGEIISNVVQQGFETAIHFIDQANANQRSDLARAAAARHDEILLQIATANASGDRARAADLQRQNEQLAALIERVNQPPPGRSNNTMLIVGGVVLLLVVVGGAFMMMKRDNPSEYEARDNVIVTGPSGKKRFESAEDVRRRERAERSGRARRRRSRKVAA